MKANIILYERAIYFQLSVLMKEVGQNEAYILDGEGKSAWSLSARQPQGLVDGEDQGEHLGGQ